MSGPKKSRWEISREIREERRRERAANHSRQIREITQRITACEERLNDLARRYGQKAGHVEERARSWILNVMADYEIDIRNAWRGLRGIENYLDNKEPQLAEAAARQDERERSQQAKAAEEQAAAQRLEAKVESILAPLKALPKNYPEIMNEGIEQRIKLFTDAVRTNPDNKQTIEQIKTFRTQIRDLAEAHVEREESFTHVRKAFCDALGGEAEAGADGGTTIKGDINGVPISVRIDGANQDIRMETPEDGSCRDAMTDLLNRLAKANVQMGPIQVLRTAQTLNADLQDDVQRDSLNA